MPKASADYVENFGKVPTSPWMSGEQAERTSAPISGAGNNTEIKLPNDQTYDEPSIVAPTRSMNTIVFSSKSGGNSIVVNDEGEGGEGYMLITHRSGSVVQIDADGTVLIKSFGDTHNSTEGLHYQRSEGDTNMSVGGEWNVMVEGGSGNVFVQGDLNVEAENINWTARGKFTVNAGEAIEMRGAKFSLEAHTDNLDLLAKNIKIGTTEKMSFLARGDILFGTETNLNITANESIKTQTLAYDLFSEDTIKLKTAALDIISDDTIKTKTAAFDLLVDDAIKLTSSTLDMGTSGEAKLGAGGNLRMSGSNAYLYGGTTHIDNMVNLAMGGASSVSASEASEAEEAAEAEIPVFPSTAEFPDPPERRPSTNSKEGVTQVQPRAGSISSRTVDDTE